MKDNFSSKSNNYAKYRPVYPKAFYNYLLEIVNGRHAAWDCGTGNGQVAEQLSAHFNVICATDISEQQIKNALPNPKIEYTIQPAEATGFADNTFDLVAIGQAVHWFNFELFYKEVKRTLKNGGVIAAVGYNKPQINPEIDAVISDFYYNVIGNFWDKERHYIDENYKTIPFPFDEIPPPQFINVVNWNLEQLTGYLRTWSAVKHFINHSGYDPVDVVHEQLKIYWDDEENKLINFPILLRIGRVYK